jgi:hypothetical protein
MKTEIIAGHAPRRRACRGCAWREAVAAGSLALLLAGCASSGTSASAPSSSAPAAAANSPAGAALCADAAALRASVDKLVHVTVAPGMASEITADYNDVKASLTTFADHAHGRWQTQTSALKSALATLQAAVKDLAATPSTKALTDVHSALAEVSAATRDLLAAVGPSCPSSSPSP